MGEVHHQEVDMPSKVEPLTLTWDNISVHVKPTGTVPCVAGKSPAGRPILDRVSGVVTPGTLLAVIGSSGAGKTTLCNVLNQRDMGAMDVEGDIRINGRHVAGGLARYVGYVQQHDTFIGTLKVKEHLKFQSKVRMGRDIPEAERNKRVDTVMRQMGLSKCANTLIGVPGIIKGISGGERKRLAFASEMITNPSLLFCDEPTSGLDSYMAQNVVLVLKDLAARGHSVVCVIHQPSSEVFALFDRMLILADGKVSFMGNSSEALTFFTNCGHPCPMNFNPADHFILTLAVVPGKEEECRQVVKYFCDSYKKSDECLRERKAIDEAKHTSPEGEVKFNEMPTKFAKCSPYRATWMQQAAAVYWRCMISTMREPAVMWSRLVPIIGQTIMVVVLYARQDYSQEGVNNLNGALFLMQTQMTFGFVWSIISTFPLEYPVFMKEHHDGKYRVDVYFICKMLAEVPQFIVLPIIWCTPVYWAIGFEMNFVNFLIALSVNIIIANVAVSFGYMLACMSSDLSVLMSMAPIFLVPIMITGGFFINISSFPSWLSWFQYLSWYRYGNEILIVNQWKDVTNISCSADELCTYHNGQDVIDYYSFDETSMAFNFVMLIVLLVGYRLLSYILLFIRSMKSFHISPASYSRDEEQETILERPRRKSQRSNGTGSGLHNRISVSSLSGAENGAFNRSDEEGFRTKSTPGAGVINENVDDYVITKF